MQYIFGIIIFLFGAVVGSFLGVVANRYNTGLSYLKGRSFCFSCNTELGKKDLFPIFSFLFLRGRCRYCGSQIPRETFWTECLMGGLTLIAFLKHDLLFDLFFDTALVWILFVTIFIFGIILLISIYDLKHFIIPDPFLIVFAIFSLVYILLTGPSIWMHLVTGVVLILPFLAIFVFSKGKWLGFGDVKYIGVIGFFLGASQGISAVVLAFWIGALFALVGLALKYLKPHFGLLMLPKDLTIKSEIPFGPFLSIGIIISFYFNVDLFQIQSIIQIFQS